MKYYYVCYEATTCGNNRWLGNILYSSDGPVNFDLLKTGITNNHEHPPKRVAVINMIEIDKETFDLNSVAKRV
jgi:hypothetical protein